MTTEAVLFLEKLTVTDQRTDHVEFLAYKLFSLGHLYTTQHVGYPHHRWLYVFRTKEHPRMGELHERYSWGHIDSIENVRRHVLPAICEYAADGALVTLLQPSQSRGIELIVETGVVKCIRKSCIAPAVKTRLLTIPSDYFALDK